MHASLKLSNLYVNKPGVRGQAYLEKYWLVALSRQTSPAQAEWPGNGHRFGGFLASNRE